MDEWCSDPRTPGEGSLGLPGPLQSARLAGLAGLTAALLDSCGRGWKKAEIPRRVFFIDATHPWWSVNHVN
jgi:hypothetical protein